MSHFSLTLSTELAPTEAWARLWDLERHTAVIPMTVVRLDGPDLALAEGAGFTGRTALGPIGFDDTMRVREWRPPTSSDAGRAVIDKTGRLLGGRIEAEVGPLRADDEGGTQVRWRQEVRLPWLPEPLRRLESVAAVLAAPGYRRVLRILLA